MRIMLGLDIVGYVLAILLVYMGYAVLSSTSQLIGDNEDAQKIQDRLESLLYSNPTFWWSISVGVVGFACVCIGIAGMMRDELRLVKIYTNWRFAYIGLNALWTIIYLFSGLARSYAELTCDLLMPPPRGPGGTPSQALPGSGFGREECVSTTMASTYQSSLTGVAIGSLVGLYFAYCVLSFYNEMYNEHLARRQPQNNLQLVPLVQQQGQVAPYPQQHFGGGQPQQQVAVQVHPAAQQQPQPYVATPRAQGQELPQGGPRQFQHPLLAGDPHATDDVSVPSAPAQEGLEMNSMAAGTAHAPATADDSRRSVEFGQPPNLGGV